MMEEKSYCLLATEQLRKIGNKIVHYSIVIRVTMPSLQVYVLS